MNQRAQASDILPDRVSCLLLNLEASTVLVPVTAVAEVINTEVAVENSQDDGPLYGWIPWREQRIPLLSLEAMMDAPRPGLAFQNRLLILNAIADMAGQGFYAIPLHGLPAPLQVDGDTLRSSGGAGELILAQCTVGGEETIIPDFPALEAAIARLVA